MQGGLYTYSALVLNVVDGDTCDVEIDLGFDLRMRHRLRLARINAPELTSPDEKIKEQAVAAKMFVTTQIAHRQVLLQTKRSDDYGRYVAEVVYTDGKISKNLSDELLSAGLAVPYPRK
jgi:micrococcal nuclease